MNNQNMPISRTTIIWILVAVLGVAGVITLILAFRGSNSAEDDVNAIYTNAALTVAAQQLTLQASQPTATVTPFVTLTPIPTNTPLATITLQPLTFATNTQAVLVTGGCDNSVYISDVTIPDKTVVTPGQAMTKTWKVQNSGTCTWTTSYKIAYVAGNAMGGATTAISQSVAPGQSIDISVAMVAPTAAGESAGTWRLTNDKAQPFGTNLTIVVNVGGNGATGTPAKTVTPGGPTVTPVTATATSGVIPTAANNPNITLTCTLGGTGGIQYEHAGTLTWEDMSDNESGFRIYINGNLVFTTNSNVVSYTVPSGTFYDTGVATTFGVKAFTGTGEAKIANVTKSCP
jgi:hypothetical protein